jgi:hypothetical protein
MCHVGRIDIATVGIGVVRKRNRNDSIRWTSEPRDIVDWPTFFTALRRRNSFLRPALPGVVRYPELTFIGLACRPAISRRIKGDSVG